MGKNQVVGECLHNKSHNVHAEIAYLEDSKRFSASLRITCGDCGRQFQFIGLPLGLDLDGAAMSVDGQEAHLAIAPVGTVPQPLDGAFLKGYRVRIGNEH